MDNAQIGKISHKMEQSMPQNTGTIDLASIIPEATDSIVMWWINLETANWRLTRFKIDLGRSYVYSETKRSYRFLGCSKNTVSYWSAVLEIIFQTQDSELKTLPA